MKKPKLMLALVAILVAGCSSDDGWDSPVIPVSLVGIEAVNIDNSGEYPVTTNSPIKKEAYMIGIKWITSNTPNDNDDKFITPPVREWENTYGSIASGYSKAIRCNTQFNPDIPAGKYVSKFFKETNRKYLPADVDEGFVLLVAPDPGEHYFTIEYYSGEELVFSYDTQPVKFF